jgi:hypothetical protein
MLIDCDTCTVRGPACSDCVVTVLLGGAPERSPGAAVELDPDEQRAIATLADSGLVPPLRLTVVSRQSQARDRPDGRQQAG